MRLNCLFVVQGEGRGHLTQALALRQMLDRAGHTVSAVCVGGAASHIPAFVNAKIHAPVASFDSLGFVTDGRRRAIQWLATLRHNGRHSRHLGASLAWLDAQVRTYQPDLVINFFEPLMGLYALRYKPAVPIVSIAHQYMALHPRYPMPPRTWLQYQAMTLFARLTAIGSARKLALSVYDAPPLEAHRLRVVPPLLRDELFTQPRGLVEPFVLVYLWDPAMAERLLHWHHRHPDVALHAFWGNPTADETEVYDDTLTFHRFHDERFLDRMARCQGLVSTAGFECLAEAMYLDKPLLMAPIQGQFEQRCNALDGVQQGAGLICSDYDIEQLLAYLPQHQPATDTYRAWVDSAEERVILELEAVVRQARRGIVVGHPWQKREPVQSEGASMAL